MPTLSNLARRIAPLALIFAPFGCSDDSAPKDALPRVGVAGTVNLDGQPLSHGSIQFNPAGGTEGSTAIAVGDIKDGKYSIDKGAGPVPGKYTVSISSRARNVISAGADPGPAPKPEPEKVPSQYNTKSTLSHEITKDDPNKADFELSKNKK